MIRPFLLAISRLLNRLSVPLSLRVGGSLGLFFYYLLPFRRAVILENLKIAFPEKSDEEVRALAKANYEHYGRSFIEAIQALSWSKEAYGSRVSVEGLPLIEAERAKGKVGFFLTSHMGNFELLARAPAHVGVPTSVIAKHARSPIAKDLFEWYRGVLGIGLISETRTTHQEVLEALLAGRWVGVFLDQFMGPPVGLPVPFFNKEAGTVVSLALFTEKRELPIFPIHCYREPDGHLIVKVDEALDMSNLPADRQERLYEKTRRYNLAIEKQVAAHPDQWIWLHRRWKAYKGEPRWKVPRLVQQTVAVLLVLFMTACASVPEKTPTGIEIPPDPNIKVPAYQVEPEETPDPTPTPEPVKNEAPKKKKPKVVSAPPPSPAPSPNAFLALAPERIPFELGERLEFDIGWMGLPAGRAIMETKKGPEMQGRPTFILWGNVLSSRLVDAIYHVDNTAESFVDAQGLIPYKFLLHMVETAQLKETRVSFDHVAQKAFYWSKRVSKKWGDETVDRTDTLTPGARDMWAALYFTRTLNFEKDKKQMFYVFENGKNWQIEMTPVGTELLNTKVGTFQCWKILIQVKLNNVLSQTGDIVLWLSDDWKRYIVKFDAKIKIGSIYGNLVSIRERE